MYKVFSKTTPTARRSIFVHLFHRSDLRKPPQKYIDQFIDQFLVHDQFFIDIQSLSISGSSPMSSYSFMFSSSFIVQYLTVSQT
jgi:hypothetical protein